jgi:hypothetical protein
VDASNRAFPNGKILFVTAIIFGFIAFAVRLKYPTGTGPLELQLGYFPLYILMMIMGVVAFRNHWLEQIPFQLTRIWKWIAILSIPVFVVLLGLSGTCPGVCEVPDCCTVECRHKLHGGILDLQDSICPKSTVKLGHSPFSLCPSGINVQEQTPCCAYRIGRY